MVVPGPLLMSWDRPTGEVQVEGLSVSNLSDAIAGRASGGGGWFRRLRLAVRCKDSMLTVDVQLPLRIQWRKGDAPAVGAIWVALNRMDAHNKNRPILWLDGRLVHGTRTGQSIVFHAHFFSPQGWCPGGV